MYAATNCQATEQWITPPEPALNRYLLRSRRSAANDNRRSFSKFFTILQIGACIALSSALTLVVALVR